MYATKKYADLSKLSNGPSSTWDGTTNTMTWTGTSNNMISNFDFAAGDYKSYEKIVVSISSLTGADFVRLQIKANGKEKLVSLEGKGTHEKTLLSDFGFTVADLESLEWIRLLGSSAMSASSASAVIESVYLETPSTTKWVDLDKMAASGGTATWNKETRVFSWSGTWSNSIPLPGLTGNLSAYTTLNYSTEKVNVDGAPDHFRILVYYSNGAEQTTYFTKVGENSVTFEDMGVLKVNLAAISSINISGANDVTGSIKLNSVYLEGPAHSYIEATTTYAAPSGTTDLNNTGWSVSYPKKIENETAWCGNIDSNEGAISLAGYDYLHFVVSSTSSNANTGLRVFVWNGSQRVCLYPRPITSASTVNNWTEEAGKSFITKPGVYVVKVSGYQLLRGFKALQGYNGNAGTSTISMAYLSSGDPVDYLPSGKYTLVGDLPGASSLTAALADANARIYDATGLTGTGVTLTPANPNALFIANEGVLTNANNVIVNGTCANLVLTDGYPFKAPADFTATSASYATTISTAAEAGTLCLPFAATLPTGVTAYALEYTSGDEATATPANGISRNTPVLINGSGEVEFTGSNVSVVAAADNVEGAMTGVFEATAVPENSYVLQNGDSGVGFYKVSSSDPITIKPFRAYLTAQNAGAALRIVYPGDATGIEAVEAVADSKDDAYYTLSGVRVSHPVKGLYIKNGKKVMVK